MGKRRLLRRKKISQLRAFLHSCAGSGETARRRKSRKRALSTFSSRKTIMERRGHVREINRETIRRIVLIHHPYGFATSGSSICEERNVAKSLRDKSRISATRSARGHSPNPPVDRRNVPIKSSVAQARFAFTSDTLDATVRNFAQR